MTRACTIQLLKEQFDTHIYVYTHTISNRLWEGKLTTADTVAQPDVDPAGQLPVEQPQW